MTASAKGRTDRLKLAFVGCGAISSMHLLGIREGAAQIEVTAAVDTNPEHAKAVAEQTDWGWKIKDLRGMAEITDDLANPRLPIGMSRRRYADDPGIPEYIEEYFGVDEARSHTEA